MKMKVEEAKDLELDESELLDLLDFDDDMWKNDPKHQKIDQYVKYISIKLILFFCWFINKKSL